MTTESTTTPPPLTREEARVVACLMEKELTVPDSYPLTLNSLTLACNQKSNREPAMHIAEGEVGHIAKVLAERGLVNIEYGERAHRFEHRVRQQWSLDKKQQALLTVMMLRAPQTLNDLKTRTKRMVDFDGLDEIALTLESLNQGEQVMMLPLPKGPGQREDRYTHLLCGEPESISAPVIPEFQPPASDSSVSELEEKIAELEQRITAMENRLRNCPI